MFKKNKYLILFAVLGLTVLLTIAPHLFDSKDNFYFEIDTATGEPLYKGKILDEFRDVGFELAIRGEVLEIPELELTQIGKILRGESLPISSMDNWIFYQANLPKEEKFQHCLAFLIRPSANWLGKNAEIDKRFVFADHSLEARKEFHFVIVDLTFKRIFSCSGNY
ncbi:MAG: hypothetical protein ACOYL6_05590 [Bacteriovoracaceae bacterium]